jgi:hypothetical protein
MGKAIRNIFKTDTLLLSECTDGFYLYDYIEGMNVVMRAKTEQEACIKALEWYQKRLNIAKEDYKTLSNKVDSFLKQFIDEDDD